jgi:hypothetical protein
MGGNGWAGRLLSWSVAGPLLTAEVSRARYFIRAERHEVLAHAEVRDLGGRYRIDIGSFPSVCAARAACERDAERRCRRDREAEATAQAGGGPVDVRIAPGRRGERKKQQELASPLRSGGNEAGKGRELPAGNYRPREAVAERSAGEALDEALRAFADVVEDRG